MTEQTEEVPYKRCEFLCVRKKRKCKFRAANDSLYCVEHIFYSEENKNVRPFSITIKRANSKLQIFN